MPRYYFDVTDDSTIFEDREGSELRDRSLAKETALRVALELGEDEQYANYYVVVRDGDEEIERLPVVPRH